MTEKSDRNSDSGRIRRRDYLAAAAAGAGSLVAGCAGGGGEEGGTATPGGEEGGTATPGGGTPATRERIPIASFSPLSGAGSPFGPGMQAGFNIAVNDVNEAGGTAGRKITPINRDSETKPSRAAAKLKAVISNENIPAFVGTWSSGVASTLAPIAADNQVMQMGDGTTSPLLAKMAWRTVGGEEVKFMGRTSPNDAMQGIAIGNVLNEKLGVSSAAFMHVDNPYGAGLARTAKQTFNGEATATVGVAKQTSDYTSALDKAFKGNPEAFVLIVYPANGETILKQWNRGGYGGKLVMSESMFVPELFNKLSSIVKGSFVTTIRPKKTNSWDYFQQAMKDRGVKVTTFSPHAYDALFLEALAIHKAGEATGPAIAKNILAPSRPPGEKVTAGPEGFEKAKSLIDDGKQINYEGASSKCNLSCFREPYNRFAINKLAADDPIKIQTEDTIPADFFKGKVYSENLVSKHCKGGSATPPPPQ
ncbi:MAG: ABC transporter substrate-binding protein [Haloferacaceae archaeon]